MAKSLDLSSSSLRATPMRASRDSIPVSCMKMAASWAESRCKGDTKVGAAIYHQLSGQVFLGYAGFPKGLPERESWWSNKDPAKGHTKHDFLIHAEENAAAKAMAGLGTTDLVGCFLCCTMLPCSVCMARVVAARGIKTVFFRDDTAEALTDRDRTVSKLLAQQLNIIVLRIQENSK